MVRNVGASDAESIKTEAWIGNAHSEKIISYLPPCRDTLIKLNVPVPSEGNYLMKVVTKFNYDVDDCLANDTLSDSLVVIDSFWEAVSQYPLGKRIKSSSSMAVKENSDSIYFWGGRNIRLFYQYFPRSNQWDTLAWLPKKFNKGFLVWTGDSFIYFIPKRNEPVCRYNIRQNIWDTLGGRVPKKIRNPSACWDRGNYIYCLRGFNQNDFYRYKISDKSWEKLNDLPYDYKIKRRGGITSKDANNIYIMGIKDNMGKLLHFQPTNNWETLRSLPYSQNKDKVRELFYADGRIYTLRDSGITNLGEMWYYDTNSNNWFLTSPRMPQFPYIGTNKVRPGACFTIWKDGKNHYGFVINGRDSRLLKLYPKPIPYLDEPLVLRKPETMIGSLSLNMFECNHYLPKFSPSGDTIICFYEDTTDDFSRLCKMDTIVLEDHLTLGEHNYEYPSFINTPDGNAIIVLKDNIVTKMNSDGSEEQELTTGLCDDPVASKEFVVYTKWENGVHRLYKVAIVGGEEEPLTGTDYNCSSPQFSPDGEKIVYEKFVNGYFHIYIYTLDTQEEEELLGGEYHHFNPRFSPDGNWIVCERVAENGNHQICKVATDGSGFEILTNPDGDYEYPSFTPDGENIVCVKWCGEGSTICQIAVANGVETPLTDSSSIKQYPEVSPDGKKVAYEVVNEDCDGNEISRIGLLRLPSIGIEDNARHRPIIFFLRQNRPNPFRNTTKINYALPKPTKVKLLIYNITGQVVRKLVENEQKEGYYEIVWDGKDNRGRKLASGIYFYRFETEEAKLIKKMIMTK